MKTPPEAQISEILLKGKDMTIATLRPDGYPQATTVSYASDGEHIYFGCGKDSQKARNLAANDRVSLTIYLPYEHWSEIRGLSAAGRARRITRPEEEAYAGGLFLKKFAGEIEPYLNAPLDMVMFEIKPEVVSVLDYRKGFGHTDLVRLEDVAA